MASASTAPTISQSTRVGSHGDLAVEACCGPGGRGRADDDGGERQEIIGLDDHGVAAAVLDASAASREGERVDVTANHAGPP